MKGLLSALALVILAPAATAQTAQPSASPAWLSPPDSILAKAIDDGFTARKLAKNERYRQVLNWMKPGIDARMEVLPPLFCALQMGQTAHDKLLPKPSVADAKTACDGRITVLFVHYSQDLNANWRCVLQNGDQTLQPALTKLDTLPRVVTYYAGFVEGDRAGYEYTDIYSFDITDAWSVPSVTLTYANELGSHGSFTLDFSFFAGDVSNRAGSLAVAAPVPQ